MHDAVQDPALVSDNPIFGQADNPSGFAYPAAGAFATLPQHERQPPRAAPRNGQHSEEILSGRLSLSSGEIAPLIDAGIVGESGRSSCRERVCQYVSIMVVAVSFKKYHKIHKRHTATIMLYDSNDHTRH